MPGLYPAMADELIPAAKPTRMFALLQMTGNVEVLALSEDRKRLEMERRELLLVNPDLDNDAGASGPALAVVEAILI